MERSALPAEAMEGMFGSVPAMSTIVRFEHRTDAVDGEAEPARDLPVRRLELTPLGHLGVELLRELGAIGAERLNLRGQGLDAAVGIAPAFGRSLQGVERGNQPARRRFDRAGVDRSRLIASRHGLWSAHLPLSPTPARRLAPCARALRTSVSPGPAFLGAAPRSSPYVHSVDLLWSAQERQALTRRNSRLSFALIALTPPVLSVRRPGMAGASLRSRRSRVGKFLCPHEPCVCRGEKGSGGIFRVSGSTGRP